MSLVVKSWLLKTNPSKGEPYFRIVGRESGLLSFLLTFVGIDATTTMVINKERFEFESGSLSGFERVVTPHEHICSAFYGQHKPWKLALAIIAIGLTIGTSISNSAVGVLFSLAGIAGGVVFYYLNRALKMGYTETSGLTHSIIFTRSVIEGQEVNEEALRRLIVIIERLITNKSMDDLPADFASGGTPVSSRMANAAPTSIEQVMAPTVNIGVCPSCKNHINPGDAFCGSCGKRL